MLRNINTSIGFSIHATDGDVGEISDFYFDDLNWTIRYLIVNTGNWLSDRLVLVSPMAIGTMDWDNRKLNVRLTKSQIEKSPNVDTRKTVSRQHEAEYLMHYGYPSYWDGPYLWGRSQQPTGLAVAAETGAFPLPTAGESHLRSAAEVRNYHIAGQDGEIGHVEDFVVDVDTWAIRYLVVNTSNWWVGHKLLVAPTWIERVTWQDAKVHLDLSRATLQNCPAYQDSMPITREYENQIHDYYQRSAYWLPKVS